MGLFEIALMTLCANLTCPDDPINEPGFGKRLALLATGIKGKHFRITTMQNKPLSYTEYENGTLVGKGVAFQFIKFLQRQYEFTYSVVLPEDDVIGNNKTGIFGMLHNRKADIAATFLPVMPTFWGFGARYSTNLDFGEWVVLMKRPKESATGSGLLAPFTFYVWILIIISVATFGPIMYYLIKLQARLCKDDEYVVYTMEAYVWFVYGSLLKQGTSLNPFADSARLLFSTWWIFITILTAFYTANLTAFLTLSRFTLPIDTPKDIGEKGYKWIARQGYAVEEATRESNGMNKLTEALKGSEGTFLARNDSYILETMVLKKDFMYIREKPIVEHLMYSDYLKKAKLDIKEVDRCTYVITTWPVVSFARAFAYANSFPYIQLFDSKLRFLVESGIVKYLLGDGLPQNKICPLDLGSKDRQLTNSDLFMTYVVVAIGFVSAGVTFIIELLLKIHCCCKRKKSKEAATVGDEKLFTKTSKNTFEKAIGDDFYGKEGEMPPPPPYHALFRPPFAFTPNGTKKTINGREYWVLSSVEGETRLVPIRSTSALLFQYTN